MSATVRNPEVVAFVAAVRRALDDLAPDEVDELTGGLEADLDDAVRDGGVVALGDPVAYAAELRSAAGLPQRDGTGVLPRPVASARRGLDAARRRLEAHPLWPGVRDFFVAIRPVWWILRAWVAYQFVSAVLGTGMQLVLPYSLGRTVLFVGLAVVSVEIGRRGLARRGAWPRRLIATGNVVAAVAVLPVLLGAQAFVVQYVSSPPEVPPNGLWLNGREVRNVFPYDAQGNPLTDVQLYDENGKPLEVGNSARIPLMVGDPAATAPSGGQVAQAQVPGVDANNRPAWNVYPLRQQEIDSGDLDASGQGRALTPPSPAAVPMRLAPVVEPPRAALPTARPTASGAPTAAPSGSPSAAPSNSPSAASSVGSSAAVSPTG